MIIRGLFTGCLPIYSLFQSSLECFYDQTCVNQLASRVAADEQFSAIDLHEQSRFQQSTIVRSILDDIMIEHWKSNFSYQGYFDHCKPSYCSYFMNERRTVIFVLTQIIGLLGGLTLILTLIIPKVVHRVRNRHLHNQLIVSSPNSSPYLTVVRRLLQRSFSFVKKTVVGLNLFDNQSGDVRIQRYQIVATRLYITILVVCLLTIALYQGIRQDVRQETVQNPTLSRYLELETLKLDNLACPCKSISVPRQKFISLEPIYHDVCSSVFVSSDWIGYLDILLTNEFLTNFPHHVNLAPSFRLLDMLCKHAQETVNDTVLSFLKTDFLSAQILPQRIFKSQFEALIQNWQLNTVNRFEMQITFFQAVQQGNKYLNEFYNFKYSINQSNGEITMIPLEYSNCSCEFSQQCRTSGPIGLLDSRNRRYYVNASLDNFFVGCSIMDALAQSTLQCFYNQTCIDEIRLDIADTNAPITIKPLPDSVAMTPTNRWPIESTETIQSIVNRLMVVEWRTNISFANYFLSCAPTHCVLEYRSRQTLFLTIIAVFSVLGGLLTGLKLLMLILIRTAEVLGIPNGHAVFRQFFVDIVSCQRRQKIVKRVRLAIFFVLVCVFYMISFVSP